VSGSRSGRGGSADPAIARQADTAHDICIRLLDFEATGADLSPFATIYAATPYARQPFSLT